MFNKTKRRLWIAGKYTNAALMLGLCSVWLYDCVQTHDGGNSRQSTAFHLTIDKDASHLKKHMRGE